MLLGLGHAGLPPWHPTGPGELWACWVCEFSVSPLKDTEASTPCRAGGRSPEALGHGLPRPVASRKRTEDLRSGRSLENRPVPTWSAEEGPLRRWHSPRPS